ncbi:MAG: NHLP bacteriocin system secretion protein [Clostridiales Family XIII bacterium]|nr:NHLP bacteriocin system secretion protein [Clostridiales Family XIII bacterium]
MENGKEGMSSKQRSVFRKVALDRLASPEQLDQRFTVISSAGWFSILSIFVLIVVALMWGIFGTISNTVSGSGVLLYGDGILTQVSHTEGQITDISLREGDRVEKGQTIARVAQRDLVLEIEETRARIEALNGISTADFTVDPNLVDTELYTDFFPIAKEIAATQDPALKDQFIKLKTLRERDLNTQLSALLDELEDSNEIVANASGTILDVQFSPYDLIYPGDALCSIIRETKASENTGLVLYVPLSDGKRIEEGMEVDVSPTTVNREEHGYILGRVTSVSDYAVNEQTVMNKVNNEQLAQMFLAQGAAVAVEVELIRDSGTVSGYKWSTPGGAPVSIEPGTMCYGSVRISNQRPIEKILPFLKGML